MMVTIKSVLAVGLAAATMAGAALTTSTPAGAWGRGGWGGPFAAGIIGGVAAGAILGAAPPAYSYYGYGYAPSYSAFGGYSACYWSRTPVYDAYGNFVGQRPIQICN